MFVRWSVPGAAHQLAAGESESESRDVWGRIEPVLQSGDVFSNIKEDGGLERRRRRRHSLFSGDSREFYFHYFLGKTSIDLKNYFFVTFHVIVITLCTMTAINKIIRIGL